MVDVETSVKITYFKFTINETKSQGECMILVESFVCKDLCGFVLFSVPARLGNRTYRFRVLKI